MIVDIRTLRHPKEKLYGTLMYVFGVIGWLMIFGFIAVSIAAGKWEAVAIMIAEFAVFYLLYLVAGALHRAYVYGHYVMIARGNSRIFSKWSRTAPGDSDCASLRRRSSTIPAES